MTADEIRTLSYVSISLVNGDLGALEQLRKECTERNPARDVTGALYYDRTMFFQVLEGPAGELHKLMRKIIRDPRHSAVRIVRDEPLPKRKFGEWSMKFVSGLAASKMGDEISYENMTQFGPVQVDHAATLLLGA